MKDELIQLLKSETANQKFGNYLLDNNLKRLDYYLENFQKLIDKFIRLKRKYNHGNMNQWSEYPEYYPHLTLFKSMTETTLHVCIDYEGGVSPSDEELSPLFEDPMIYSQPDFKKEKDEYYYVDANEEIHNNLFFTFLSLAWLKANGQECGLVVKTLENNSTQSFYLNDLKWNGASKFQNFTDRNIIIRNTYKNSISIKELYDLVKGIILNNNTS